MGTRRFVFGLVVAIVSAAGCGGSQGQLDPPVSDRQTTQAASALSEAASSYKLLFSFGGPDGANPDAGLTPLSVHSGPFFGTTQSGGTYDFGTVFNVMPTGKESVLHNFEGGKDGFKPIAPLLLLNGTFYGVAAGFKCRPNHPGSCGIIFSADKSGKERAIYQFKGPPDGAYPSAGLTAFKGVLYGTTDAGGLKNCSFFESTCGTVFSVTTTGKERILYRFKNGSDGAGPLAALTVLNGTLFGTTWGGGTNNCYPGGYKAGCGTIFSITTTGHERVIYRFAGGSDGSAPFANLTVASGKLYGTTYDGGIGCPGFGCGTVFSITAGGTKRVVYRFSGTNGASPASGVVVFNGTLYGTTEYTGAGGYGTVFSLTTTGRHRVLHFFKGGLDGEEPLAPLTALDGVLYGTTSAGGQYSCGCGTVFSVAP